MPEMVADGSKTSENDEGMDEDDNELLVNAMASKHTVLLPTRRVS